MNGIIFATTSVQAATLKFSRTTTNISMTRLKILAKGDAMFAAQINYITSSYSNFLRFFAIRKISIGEIVGGNREYRMALVTKRMFKRWLEENVQERGHANTWTLFGEPAFQRFLRHQGFKRIRLDKEGVSFTTGIAIGWLPLPVKRKQFYLPRWSITYTSIEKIAKRKSGNISFGEALSLYDTMEAYDEHMSMGT
ncbi:MAG: hypothetical protein NXH70_02290 [Hyphomonas sp.]|nr:hypothetical protein [Hyphomonas sp.]